MPIQKTNSFSGIIPVFMLTSQRRLTQSEKKHRGMNRKNKGEVIAIKTRNIFEVYNRFTIN